MNYLTYRKSAKITSFLFFVGFMACVMEEETMKACSMQMKKKPINLDTI